MIRFAVESQMPLRGTLVYREDEYSFDTEPRSENGVASLLLNDVQLEVDEEGRVLYVWGLCAHTAWAETDTEAPPAQPGVLRAAGITLAAGISKRINNNDPWPATVNRRGRWVCLGDPEIRTGQCVSFAPGSRAVLLDGEIKALWLHPKQIPR
jgi:hypothetical protein